MYYDKGIRRGEGPKKKPLKRMSPESEEESSNSDKL
jgi:hypothetical protein